MEITESSQPCFRIQISEIERSVHDMTMNEMKQTVALCVATLQKLNGRMPDFKTLCNALGNEYTILVSEFLHENSAVAA